MLINNALCQYVCVTIFSTGGKFQMVSNFTELHALTQAAHSYFSIADRLIANILMHYASIC